MAAGLTKMNLPRVLPKRVRAALAGNYDAGLLSADKAELFDDLLGAAMDGANTAAAREFWARFQGERNTDR